MKKQQEPTQDPVAETIEPATEHASPHADKSDERKLEPETPTPQRSSSRWPIVLLLLAALLVTAYWQRERWWKFLSGQNAEPAQAAKEKKILYWVDPMHPAYRSNKPGTAPDCGMDLVPVYEGGEPAGAAPEGAIQISPEKQQLIGVEYGQVESKPVSRMLRAVGRVAYDETRITRVHSKIEGWLEEVFVDFTGKEVRRGQPLLTVYSPELWQTQQEYLLARKGRDELSTSPFREAVAGSESLLEAARKRLELWDVTEEQLRQLDQTGKPIKAMTMHAPAGGFVLTRNAFPKQRVTPETELYVIADLSSVWVLADVYEYESPEIKLGQQVDITLPYLSGKTFRGRVSNIAPQLDAATRTLKVRVEVPNPGLMLKPDMYANVELKIDYGRQLVVPQEAVMDSGAETTVFVAHEGGYFEPRRVTTGAKIGNEVIITSGLKAGERVVTSANFLIDSESRLKSATGAMGGHEGHGDASPSAKSPDNSSPHTPDHSGHSSPTPKATLPASATPPETENHSRHQAAPAAPANAARKIAYWYCTMHPEQRSDKPGQCPLCKMKFVPKYADEKGAKGGKP